MFLLRFVRIIFIAASILIIYTTESFSQEEELPASFETKGAVWRLGFWEILHQTFSSDEDHPFYQMTGTSRFKGGQGFFGFTLLDPGTNGIIPTVQNKNDDDFFKLKTNQDFPQKTAVAPSELYSCTQNRPSAASETPARAHPGASGPFPPATHTLRTLWPAGLAGGDLWWSPAAVPQAKDAKAPVGDGARRRLGGGLVGESGDYHRHQRHLSLIHI